MKHGDSYSDPNEIYAGIRMGMLTDSESERHRVFSRVRPLVDPTN